MPEPIDFSKARDERAERHHLIPCAHCGKDIPMHSTRCPKCGVHFEGEAFQYTYERGSTGSSGPSGTAKVMFGLFLVLVFLAVLTYLLAR